MSNATPHDTDRLTGLLTRSVFEKINTLSSSCDTYVIEVDVKNMMSINDCCGHNIGDSLIVAHTEYLKSIMRYNDIFRTGGNEWSLIVPLSELSRLAEELFANDISTAIIFSDGKLEELDKKLIEYQAHSVERKVGALYVSKIFLIGRGV
jgi:diguanylate cyclase (GGDEF)-like protein